MNKSLNFQPARFDYTCGEGYSKIRIVMRLITGLTPNVKELAVKTEVEPIEFLKI